MLSHHDVKVTILGQKDSGKTALFNRYVYDEFGKTSMTIGAYFGMKQLKIDDTPVNLAIWDTAGDDGFSELTTYYCRNANVLYYVINGSKHKPDIDKEIREREFDEDIKRLKSYVDEAPDAVVHILINRSDAAKECKDAPDRAEATKRAIVARLSKEKKDENSPLKDKDIEVTIISAKTGKNVVEAIHSSLSKIVDRIKQAVQSKPKAKAKQAEQLMSPVEAKQAVQKKKTDDELIREMVSIYRRLEAELKSCCFNRNRKYNKYNFLDRVLKMYNKEKHKIDGGATLSECIAAIEANSTHDEMQDVIAGTIWNRTKNFFQENDLNLKVLLPKTTHDSLFHPLVEVRSQK